MAMQRRRNIISALLIVGLLGAITAIVFATLANGGAFNPPPPRAKTITSDYPGQLLSAKNLKAPKPQADGLQILDIKAGTGAAAKGTDTVTVNYTGWLTDGTVFDSSILSTIPQPHVQPAQFSLSGGVIQGWQEGLVGMKVGGVRRLYIPAALAYGDSPPDGSGIQPGATLVFEIQLISIP
jgi:FKBP-type peptidyl-prolyl cis-trans isomerase